MSNWIDIFIFIHAVLGGIALVSGGIALTSKKGGNFHKKSGRVFYYSMIASAVIAMIISNLPNHINNFLFFMGIFSLYFVLSGYSSLGFKSKHHNFILDKMLAYTMLLNGLFMLIYPIIATHKIHLLFAIFGTASLFFSFQDFRNLRRKEHLRKKWLQLHLGKMSGGYISALSAFFVVNNILPGIWNWIAPGIVGGIYITLKIRTVNKS